jgi:OOP family OmpA-OmpF porin
MNSLPALRLLSLGVIGAVGTLAASAALAQSESYYFGGLSVGASKLHIDQAKESRQELGGAGTATSTSFDDKGLAFKAFGGYQFNRHFGLEAGYFNLGRFGFNAATAAPAGSLAGRMRIQGIDVDAVGTLPLSERFSATARIGLQYHHTSDSFSGTGGVVPVDTNPTKGKTSYKVGAGLQYAVSPSLFLRAGIERFRINDAIGNNGAVNMVSVGLVVPFGRGPAPVAYVAPAYVAPPPVVAQAAAPPPPVAPAPVVLPPPPRTKVTFSAESLFGFDKSAVQPSAKPALDTFAKELDGTRYEAVNVTGHTDRIGSPAYNQRLSQERADAVKNYLVTEGKLNAAKVTAVGKGETEPLTKPDDCKGKARTAKLIACLQPDRRVEVEVTGTR